MHSTETSVPLMYPARVHDAGEGAFWIEFPDFPEASTRGHGNTDDLVETAARCLADCIYFRVIDGRSLPAPSVPHDGDIMVKPATLAQPVAA